MDKTKIKIFITGANGKLGKPLTSALIKKGYEVFCASRHRGIDILDKERLKNAIKWFAPNIIIHLATDPKDLENKTEYEGTFNLIQIARKLNIRKIIFASSCMVYEESALENHKEDEELYLTLRYPVAKICAERLISQVNNHLIFRIATVYDGVNHLPLIRDLGLIYVMFESHRFKVSYLHIKDFVNAVIYGIDKDLTGTFNLASFTCQYRDIALSNGVMVIPLCQIYSRGATKNEIIVTDKIKSKGFKFIGSM